MSGLGPSDSAVSESNTRGPALLAVSVTTTCLALGTCLLRYCVSSRINRRIQLDDYCAGVAMVRAEPAVNFGDAANFVTVARYSRMFFRHSRKHEPGQIPGGNSVRLSRPTMADDGLFARKSLDIPLVPPDCV